MKINLYTGGFLATYSSRMLPLANFLKNCGIECEIISPINWYIITNSKIKNIMSIIIPHPPKYYLKTLKSKPNIVIISRTSNSLIHFLTKLLKYKSIKYIFDLDDALFLHKSKFLGYNVRPGTYFLEKIIRNANYVTTNGHYLLDYIKKYNLNSKIIYDPIDTKLFHPKFRTSRNKEKITIGWEGVPKNHYDNLSLLIDPLKKLGNEYDIIFKIISYLGDLRVKEIFCELEKFVEVDYGLSQWTSMDTFPKLLSDVDIMVAPLQRTPWYEGKSSHRVGISMAMGIPVVASPVGEQKYIVNHRDNGFFARNEDEWYQYIKILIEENYLRREMGKKGRETAEKELSLKVCGVKMFKILRRLME